MTTIHLVRHGRTVWHDGNRYAGASDVALDDVGRAQAAALAPWAASAGLDAVVASDLTRAIDTARVAADAAGVELRVDARLREVDFGSGEGLTTAEQEARMPQARAAFVARPASSPLPGGEAGADAAARAWAALGDVVDAVGDGTALVVAHTTLIRLVLCRALGIPLDEYRRVLPRLDNATRTTLDARRDGDGLRVALLAYNAPVA
ncbi:histidine phosphatase family protein [Agrococcus sp. SGAir0287]|uniref:histidine phosphatase family protein n=1 Tax=Agrococcus sp. SGAir0287 TaxID=2070347 RepID=UPI0010CD5285|nr:histidine phosphatase family protein [Agrococcus sp. SGAir0287]QCR18358.1 histidine phosphatase family protein [Agrococcus sp. SGAir0287]